MEKGAGRRIKGEEIESRREEEERVESKGRGTKGGVDVKEIGIWRIKGREGERKGRKRREKPKVMGRIEGREGGEMGGG